MSYIIKMNIILNHQYLHNFNLKIIEKIKPRKKSFWRQFECNLNASKREDYLRNTRNFFQNKVTKGLYGNQGSSWITRKKIGQKQIPDEIKWFKKITLKVKVVMKMS